MPKIEPLTAEQIAEIDTRGWYNIGITGNLGSICVESSDYLKEINSPLYNVSAERINEHFNQLRAESLAKALKTPPHELLDFLTNCAREAGRREELDIPLMGREQHPNGFGIIEAHTALLQLAGGE